MLIGAPCISTYLWYVERERAFGHRQWLFRDLCSGNAWSMAFPSVKACETWVPPSPHPVKWWNGRGLLGLGLGSVTTLYCSDGLFCG